MKMNVNMLIGRPKINWRFVDKVIYINLEKRKDRRESIENELIKVGVPEEKIIRFNAVEHQNGALGCAMSHRDVLMMAKENHWENVLILEDDMIFNEDDESLERINYFFSALMYQEWDAAFLSGSYFKVEPVHGCLYRIRYSYLSNSYIVNQHYYDTLIDVFERSIKLSGTGKSRYECSLDLCWNQIMGRDNWYAIYPCVGYQRVDHSDIENYVTDRVSYFGRTIEKMEKGEF